MKRIIAISVMVGIMLLVFLVNYNQDPYKTPSDEVLPKSNITKPRETIESSKAKRTSSRIGEMTEVFDDHRIKRIVRFISNLTDLVSRSKNKEAQEVVSWFKKRVIYGRIGYRGNEPIQIFHRRSENLKRKKRLVLTFLSKEDKQKNPFHPAVSFIKHNGAVYKCELGTIVIQESDEIPESYQGYILLHEIYHAYRYDLGKFACTYGWMSVKLNRLSEEVIVWSWIEKVMVDSWDDEYKTLVDLVAKQLLHDNKEKVLEYWQHANLKHAYFPEGVRYTYVLTALFYSEEKEGYPTIRKFLPKLSKLLKEDEKSTFFTGKSSGILRQFLIYSLLKVIERDKRYEKPIIFNGNEVNVFNAKLTLLLSIHP